MTSLDQIIHNPGFHAVAIAIFLNLDPESLGNCRLLSKVYKDFIDNTKSMILLKIKQAFAKRESILLRSIPAGSALSTAFGISSPKDLISKSKASSKLFYNLFNEHLGKFDLKTVFEFIKTTWANPEMISKEFNKNGKNIFNYVLSESPVEVRKSKLFEDFISIFFHLATKDSEKMNVKLENILMVAIKNTYLTLVEKILNHTIQTGKHFDLNNIQEWNWAPLYEALFTKGKLEIVKLLLDYPSAKKIKLNHYYYNKFGVTQWPLFHTACSRGPIEVVELFLDYIQKYEEDFDFNSSDAYGRIPMHYTRYCKYGGDGDIAYKLLKLHKEKKIILNFNAKELERGQVFWHSFASNPCRIKKHFENLKIVLDLSKENDQNINIDIVDNRGWNVLHYACLGEIRPGKIENIEIENIENIETVKLLLEHYGMTNRINPYAQDIHGDTPLHLACSKKHPFIVEVFVDYGLVNDIKNHKGLTPIEIALKNGCQKIVKLLTQNEPPAKIPKTKD